MAGLEPEQPLTVFRPLRHAEPDLRSVGIDQVMYDLDEIVSTSPATFLEILAAAKRIAIER